MNDSRPSFAVKLLGKPLMQSRLFLLLAFSLALAGCYSVHDDGTTLTIHYALWLRALSVLLPLGFLAVLAALCFLPKKRPTLRLVIRILAIVGIIFTLFPVVCCVPTFIIDSIEISPTGIHRKTGFWFAPTVQSANWSDIASFSMESDNSRPDRPLSARIWHARRKDGSSLKISPGDLGKAAEGEVRAKIESLGIKVDYAVE